MSDSKFPFSRREFMKGVGTSAALLSIGSAQAAADSAVNQNPQVDEVAVEENVMVEMRDGTQLATDVYLPDPPGQSERARGPYPTLITRTPYNKEFYDPQAEALARQEYAVVTQDVRGKFASEGTFYPYRSEGNAEAQDGYDTIEWAAEQSWSNGAVGTYGISYMGGTQWALAHNEELPPSLETMAPGYASASYYHDLGYTGGAAKLAHNLDYLIGMAIEQYRREELPDREEGEAPVRDDQLFFLEEAQEAITQLYWDLPVVPFEPIQEAGYPWLNDWHTNETYGDYWREQDHTPHYGKVDVPVLNYGGWYDILNRGTVRNFRGLSKETDVPTTLVMGPYTHGDEATRAQGQVMGHAYQFPENAPLDETALLVSWFDSVLKDGGQPESPPPVRLYVPGLDEWIGASDFPLQGTEFMDLYLHSEGTRTPAPSRRRTTGTAAGCRRNHRVTSSPTSTRTTRATPS